MQHALSPPCATSYCEHEKPIANWFCCHVMMLHDGITEFASSSAWGKLSYNSYQWQPNSSLCTHAMYMHCSVGMKWCCDEIARENKTSLGHGNHQGIIQRGAKPRSSAALFFQHHQFMGHILYNDEWCTGKKCHHNLTEDGVWWLCMSNIWWCRFGTKEGKPNLAACTNKACMETWGTSGRAIIGIIICSHPISSWQAAHQLYSLTLWRGCQHFK